jgi:hypothetical protein
LQLLTGGRTRFFKPGGNHRDCPHVASLSAALSNFLSRIQSEL